MSDEVSKEEAEDLLRYLCILVMRRYPSTVSGLPISEMDMPEGERTFYLCYALDDALGRGGFDGLLTVHPKDTEEFIGILNRLGAKETSAFVRMTMAKFKSGAPCSAKESYEEYCRLYLCEKVWLKLLEFVEETSLTRYFLKAEQIHAAGKNVFDPGEWQGELPDADDDCRR